MSARILDVTDEYADYLHDESRRAGYAEKIVFPGSTEEVREALAAAHDTGWSVTVQGGRTGITGGCVPEGGLILNLSRMNFIGPVVGDRMVVQPGATLGDIRAALDESGWFFPPDLTETTATIGGMISNNASGARSLRYGSVRSAIHALEIVLPNGEPVRLERSVHKADGLNFTVGSITGKLPVIPVPDVKTAAGYFMKPDMDLVDLFIGAEGTLGVVTEITIRLLPVTERMIGLTVFFSVEDEALQFVRFLREARWGTGPAEGGGDAGRPLRVSTPVAIEFFDLNALELLRRMKSEHPAFSNLPELQPEFNTALYVEFEGEIPEVVVERVGNHAVECWVFEGDHKIEMQKNLRHAVPEAVNILIGARKKEMPELTKLGTDMSVPNDRMEAIMQMYHTGLADAGLEYVIFGHIGNNHLHVNILPRNGEDFERGKALYLAWAKQVVEWGGSVSAEHGIGKLKAGFLKIMFGEEGVGRMRAVKSLFDPKGRLNPGNLFG